MAHFYFSIREIGIEMLLTQLACPCGHRCCYFGRRHLHDWKRKCVEAVFLQIKVDKG